MIRATRAGTAIVAALAACATPSVGAQEGPPRVPPPLVVPPPSISPAPSATVATPPTIRIIPPPDLTPEQRRRQDREIAEYEAARERAMREEGMFGLVTLDMDVPQVLVLCDTIAEHHLSAAASTGDEATRRQQAIPAWQLQQRTRQLTSVLEEANPANLGAMKSKAGQAIGLMSYAPSPEMQNGLRDGVADEGRVMLVFMRDIAARCEARLDRMGLDRVTQAPPDDLLNELAAYRIRGRSAAETFGDTQLAPIAVRVCTSKTARDFSTLPRAPLDQRGLDGISLLDWAMECGDLVAFDALLAAGHDLEAAGQFGKPPVVVAAELENIQFLRALLDQGASPDSVGRGFPGTALRAAAFAESQGKSNAAYVMLREAGASLNFPDYQHSMWSEWTLRANWQEILDHWDQFALDPIQIARSVSMENDRGNPRGDAAALLEIKRRLETQYGVCFPVVAFIDLENDEAGRFIQPDCPKPQ